MATLSKSPFRLNSLIVCRTRVAFRSDSGLCVRHGENFTDRERRGRRARLSLTNRSL